MAASSSSIFVCYDVFKEQYISCMKDRSGGNLG